LMFAVRLTLTANAACGQNVGYLNVKPGGAFTDQRA